MCAQRKLSHFSSLALHIDNMSTSIALSPPNVNDLVNEEICPIEIEREVTEENCPEKIKQEVDVEWLKETAIIGMGITIENLDEDLQRIKEKYEKLKGLFFKENAPTATL